MVTNKQLKIVIGILVSIILIFGFINLTLPNYNKMVIKDYQKYLVDRNLVVIQGVNENNVTGIGEVTLEYVMEIWRGNIENQAVIVQGWIENAETRELIQGAVCLKPKD